MPLYFILSVDGNGQSEIVALFLLTQEEEIMLSSVIELFKNHNSSWKDAKVILTDKNMSERNVLGKAMPQENLQLCLQLCLFHVLRNFRREITPEKLGITPGEKNSCLRNITKYSVLKIRRRIPDIV